MSSIDTRHLAQCLLISLLYFTHDISLHQVCCSNKTRQLVRSSLHSFPLRPPPDFQSHHLPIASEPPSYRLVIRKSSSSAFSPVRRLTALPLHKSPLFRYLVHGRTSFVNTTTIFQVNTYRDSQESHNSVSIFYKPTKIFGCIVQYHKLKQYMEKEQYSSTWWKLYRWSYT